MIFLQHIPAVFSAILLALHFLRDGQLHLVILCLFMPVILFFPGRLQARSYQGFLLLGAAIWFLTALDVVHARMAAGQSWVRVIVILGAVTLFTLWSARLFETAAMRARYRLGGDENADRRRSE